MSNEALNYEIERETDLAQLNLYQFSRVDNCEDVLSVFCILVHRIEMLRSLHLSRLLNEHSEWERVEKESEKNDN